MLSSVASYYDGQSVFITGGTGFLGKILIEKLLRSCPGLNNVYVLVRGKRNVNAQQIIETVFDTPLFSQLKNENPEVFTKVITIVGDVSKPNLGLTDDDEKLLTDNVSVVFHLAATVKFNEPLDVAFKVNVTGTEQILNLSKRMKNIKVFTHVSTTYSSTDKYNVKEVLYPAPFPVNELKKVLEAGITKEQEKKLVEKFPNTYTFTKALAESFIASNHGNIPCVIVRPSIIASSSKMGTVAGWIDNWNGSTAFMTMAGKGLVRVLLSKNTNKIDLIPVDYVANLLIVATSKHKCTKDVALYNSSTSGENKITMRQFIDLFIEDSLKNKFYEIPLPFVVLTESNWQYFLLTLFLEKIPAYTADIFLLLMGKQARFMKIQTKMSTVRDVSEFVSTYDWVIHASQTIALAQSLSPLDKHLFPCDPTDINWNEFVPTYCKGVRQFLCKL